LPEASLSDESGAILVPEQETEDPVDRCECPDVWTGAWVTLLPSRSSGPDAGSVSSNTAEDDAGIITLETWTLDAPVGDVHCGEKQVYGRYEAGCGVALYFHACAGRGAGTPCLELTGNAARLTDAQGRVFDGSLERDAVILASAITDAVVAGAFTVDVNDGSTSWTLSVEFAFCGRVRASRTLC
jgi:hypothetical protein